MSVKIISRETTPALTPEGRVRVAQAVDDKLFSEPDAADQVYEPRVLP
jgi:hypothetical protein